MAGVVCCVLYGDYPKLHHRFLQGLTALPADVPVFLGLNAIGAQSLDVLHQHTDIPLDVTSVDGHASYWHYRVFTHKNENRYKYPVMREMFSQLGDDWSLWLDDDTLLPADTKWWDALVAIMQAGVDYTGVSYGMQYMGNQEAFIRSRPWYRGLPPLKQHGASVFRFYTGSFWGLSAAARKTLDWPDNVLRHNGGDTMLGEAVRQHQLRCQEFPCAAYGIRINSARRRGHTETPIGVRE